MEDYPFLNISDEITEIGVMAVQLRLQPEETIA